jgi:branched-chain amino acid transport system permease protein
MGIVSILGNGIPMIYRYVDAPPIPELTNELYTQPIIIEILGKNLQIEVHALICLGITVVLIGVLFALLRFSKWGLGVRTTASNEYVAQMMGVNTYAITAISWGIAGGLGAIACVMYVGGPGKLSDPFIMTNFQVNAFLAGVLGGFGTFAGPVIAAVIIPVVESSIGLLANIDSIREFITTWTPVILYILIMIAIYIKPNGLFGKKVVKKV